MAYLGSWDIDDVLTFYAVTTVFSTGVATDADAVPAYRVYEDETTTPILTGNMALLDSANTAGLYSEQITLSAANGFEAGKQYAIHKAATVSSVAGASHDTFQIRAKVNTVATASALTFNLTGSVTGSVGSVTGSVGSVTGAVGSVTGAVGSVTGSVGGNVTGSVGSVVAGVTLSATGSAALTESYRANGAAGTLPELMYEVLAHLGEASIAGTTKTLNKINHVTPAGTFTLDSATAPTSITRAT